MRTLSPALADHLTADVTTLATCFLLRRRDGVRLGFTSADRELIVDGTRYLPRSGLTPSQIAASRELKVDEMEVLGALSAAGISDGDLRAGLYDFAEITVSLVNYAAPESAHVVILSGWIGEVSIRRGVFVAEVRGLSQALQQTFGDVYSPECRADLGDHRCRVDLALVTMTASVSGATSKRTFSTSALGKPDGWFDYGVLRWLTGDNAGRQGEIRRHAGNTLELYDAATALPQAGDVFTVSGGCDKRFVTCRSKFANAENFRGEPHVPGVDSLLNYPGLR
jgi:uncharacterized phage protein (TIGR02218 family)